MQAYLIPPGLEPAVCNGLQSTGDSLRDGTFQECKLGVLCIPGGCVHLQHVQSNAVDSPPWSQFSKPGQPREIWTVE